MCRYLCPQLHTLQKIVEFFQLEGFDITLNDLIEYGNKRVNFNEVFVKDLPKTEQKIQLYQLYTDLNKIGTINTDVEFTEGVLIGFKCMEFIPPMFKSGTVFIANRTLDPEEGNLVIVKYESSRNFQVRKVSKDDGGIGFCLEDVNKNNKIYEYNINNIIGVVVQVNAKV